MWLKCLIIAIFSLRVCCFQKRYENYSLIRVKPESEQHQSFLNSLQDNDSMGVKYWRRPGTLNRTVSMIVSPEKKRVFMRRAAENDLNVSIILSNIQREFDNQKVFPYIKHHLNSFEWSHYHDLNSINNWLTDLAQEYRGDRVRIVNIGKSIEGRNILGLYLQSPWKEGQPRAVFVEGGIHGREWISPAFVTYLIHQLVTRYKKDNNLMIARYKYDWHIFPVVNPDGYAYTHSHDRDWRKNRRYGREYIGVDLNRNFDYRFDTFGGNRDPNSETFCGPYAFSEPESAAIRNYVERIGHDLMFYLSIHSFGQFLLLPFSDSRRRRSNYWQVRDLSRKGIKKLQSLYNTSYSVGTAYETMGVFASGTSNDWVKNYLRVPVSINFELRDKGEYGFALPSKYILPTCKETLACILEMVDKPGSLVRLRSVDIPKNELHSRSKSVSIDVKSADMNRRILLFSMFALIVKIF